MIPEINCQQNSAKLKEFHVKPRYAAMQHKLLPAMFHVKQTPKSAISLYKTG